MKAAAWISSPLAIVIATSAFGATARAASAFAKPKPVVGNMVLPGGAVSQQRLDGATAPRSSVHVWEQVEITLRASNTYANPYTDTQLWVDLEGPGFARRCYGFWDGGNTFRVRVLAPTPGQWRWRSGSQPEDAGLAGQSGGFKAVPWTDAEKQANLCRRGNVRATANGHAFEHADGTPFFLLGDTWWATPTFRFRWRDDDLPRSPGPEAGFKDFVRFRRQQEFNCIALIAALPNWANDGLPANLKLSDGTVLRSAWPAAGTDRAKDMTNEFGQRAFLFPGKVPGFETVFPDVDRLNPSYFQTLDWKMDYLNAQGLVPFIEVARRDIGQAWKKFYPWPQSYVRFIQYVWSRYQAHIALFSPIHFDTPAQSIPPEEWNRAAKTVIEQFGPPPFGTLVGNNANPSSLRNWGHVDRAPWLGFHQIGNRRTHDCYAYLTEIFEAKPPLPGINGEPYYDGMEDAAPGSERAALYCRSAMYGSVLSGGLGGHIYGAGGWQGGLWSGEVEAASKYPIWEVIRWTSADQMRHLKSFILSEDRRYLELEPATNAVSPNRSGNPKGLTGWAYAAGTPDRDLFLLYFEQDCPPATLNGARYNAQYQARWFNPRTGEWRDAEPGSIKANAEGKLVLPPFPGTPGKSDADWALKLASRERTHSMSKPPSVRVAGIVLKWLRGHKAANYRRIEPLIREAAAHGAQIVCTTECFLDGYAIADKSIPLEQYRALGEAIPEGEYFRKLAGLARELKIVLIAGMLEAHGEQRFNTAALIGPDGALIGKYHKQQLEHEALRNTAGNQSSVFDTPFGKIGVMICADRRFPEVVKGFCDRGAEFLICPSGGMFGPKSNDPILQARSKENGKYIVFVHPAEFLVTGPDGTILEQTILGARLLIAPEQIGTAADSQRVFYFDVPRMDSISTNARTSLGNPAVRYSAPDQPYVILKRGGLEAVVVDNRAVNDAVLPGHRAGYHGIALLRHAQQSRNLFVPAYAGLNFEHIHDGTVQSREVLFEPRHAPMELRVINGHTAELYQASTPHWGLESCMRYELVGDNVIELTFECVPRRDTFKNGYVGLFWASYIDQPESLDIHFRGYEEGAEPTAGWVRGVTPAHGTLATHRAPDDRRAFPHDPAFPLELPFGFSHLRYAEPWYFGVCRGMAFVQMFRAQDAVRLTQSPSGGGSGCPAWDFQWFIEQPRVGRRYQLVMRAAYVPVTGPGDGAQLREPIARVVHDWQPKK